MKSVLIQSAEIQFIQFNLSIQNGGYRIQSTLIQFNYIEIKLINSN